MASVRQQNHRSRPEVGRQQTFLVLAAMWFLLWLLDVSWAIPVIAAQTISQGQTRKERLSFNQTEYGH